MVCIVSQSRSLILARASLPLSSYADFQRGYPRLVKVKRSSTGSTWRRWRFRGKWVIAARIGMIKAVFMDSNCKGAAYAHA